MVYPEATLQLPVPTLMQQLLILYFLLALLIISSVFIHTSIYEFSITFPELSQVSKYAESNDQYNNTHQ
jgi:hypothetical protein